ncbi:MAG: hypothetical protein NDF53_03500 [archaeon GB-1867-097]|nr:hypothetical protein [Candidatus Culexmicrobium thermophilum]
MDVGCTIIMDLDRFAEYTLRKGLNQYKPNIITGTLTHLVEEFIEKFHAVHIFGLDEERGTEEAILELPYVDEELLEKIRLELERIRRVIEKLGGSITIAVSTGPVTCKPVGKRREAYMDFNRKKASKILRRAKRRGGNRVIIF